MTNADAVQFLTQFERFQPAYARWREEESRALASRNGTRPIEEARAMLASMVRTLANVTNEEAGAALAAMETGELEVPPYGRLALTVRGHAFDDRSARRMGDRYNAERERRLHCLACEDSGIVSVLNPEFVEWLRPTFAAYQEGGFPSGWRGAAYREWRMRDTGRPMLHSALCNCSCQRANLLRDELEAFRKNERRIKGAPLGPPACGNAVYDPKRMPLCGAAIMLQSVLAEWYATHEVNSGYEWEPTQSEYDARFN